MPITIESLKEAIHIKEQIAALEERLGKLFGAGVEAVTAFFKPAPVKKGRRKMSAAARAKIAAAQKARRAKAKSTSDSKGVEKAPKKKRKMSAEGRARIAAAQKARWAAHKKKK